MMDHETFLLLAAKQIREVLPAARGSGAGAAPRHVSELPLGRGGDATG